MIKLEHVVLPSPDQMEFVIEGMRNPKNSWDKSDSKYGCSNINDCPINGSTSCDGCIEWKLGENDIFLMDRLSNGGPVHSKYMRMMPVMVRITAPLYWWKEFDTYKVGTVANSCSTMHKIQAKEFEFSDFSFEHLFDDEAYISIKEQDLALSSSVIRMILHNLNVSREKFLETGDKKYWWQMIQLLPSSYNQTRNVILNYEVLKNIYIWRKDHKLDEWREFCKWIESLPYSELITNKAQ